ncbi:MAG: hypothetical protein COW18_02030 [Zetaproteobacteria bacterium CG12_big_fil_rev_8_21_14_0_65_54_13]|nr:MAG: hypothetical protein COX55_03735 [Zetaproteobacteria bacterium CG23_combo_of_CG06-09_8_20_14_all_54_7]PIW51207.1 MAG: hypothetical protein COW18_02030 [Zetaproteobacteria bacterium CG12_big_fil_rev_8_21_14_0_65_54_13]PIX53505.1 MAG: hypothetical protein COZ50_12725 [Zetaproteobacteria bacterium CG_4_10_14_3_um_filter_54_28]PJA28315.1 MAG: hypothetical protein CO188_09770 [Zetaproteobacteria bacterium CG_4_9_14_3_um_filter_54_145]
MQSLYHEATHQIEWVHNVKLPNSNPRSERNTDYLDRVTGILRLWKLTEQQAMGGVRTAEETLNIYRNLQANLQSAEKTFIPETGQLESWAGIRIRFEDIHKLYRSGTCGKVLKKVAEYFDHGIEKPAASIKNTPAQNKSSQQHSPSQTAASTHIVYAMVYDQATGTPVAGAAFSVLQPGISTAQWISAGFDKRFVASHGISDASGMVALHPSLLNGKSYSFVIARESYKVVRYESLTITTTSPEPLKITVKLKRQ